MINKSEIKISSTNGKNQLHTIIWKPENEVRGILQISHGMVEYVNRYDRFATFLAERGFLVVGNDHLGHGNTVREEQELGYFGENGSQTVVNDLYEVTKYMKKQYPNIPYYVLGHSMGSFIIRRYIMTYGSSVDGTIIMGTGSQPDVVLKVGKMVVKLLSKIKGAKYRSQFVDKMAFGTYNKKFAPVRTNKDWLTKDTDVVDDYIQHPFCSFLFTLNGFYTLFDTISFIQIKENISRIPKEMPIFMIAGDMDPVGNYGKAVKQVYRDYQQEGINNIRMKLYSNDRHEILNELDYQVVQQDIYDWLLQQL